MSKVFTITEGLENMGALRTGGQGSVYKGRRMGPVFSAIKLLPTPIAYENTSDRNYRNFINEVEKLTKVNTIPNPNVVKILSYGVTESGSLPFIEMEFIEGPDLGELLAPPHSKVFTIKEVIRVAEQLAGALAHCHSVGVKHGDIKSNNVKFNVNTGNYVLLDFGLSVMSEEQRRTSMRNAGAIEFMAPEQNHGEMLFQTDIYSYGVILYELLAGQVPFPLQDSGETSRNAVMVAHLEQDVPDIAALRMQNLPEDWTEEQKQREASIPAWLLGIIQKCLEKAPEKRFGNGMDLQDGIIKGSMAVAAGADDSLTALKTEAEILRLQVAQYQEKSKIEQQSSVIISKTRLKIALAVVGVLLVLSIYGMFKKSVVYYPATPPNAKYLPAFMLNPYHPEKTLQHPEKTVLQAKATTDSIISHPKAHAKPPKRKPKRKKFLGIF